MKNNYGKEDSRSRIPLLKVDMVFMSYPVPSETFAERDVRSLRKLGHIVDTWSLLGKRNCGWRRLIKDYLGALIYRPGLLRICSLGLRIIFSSGFRSLERLKCLLLLIPAARLAYMISGRRTDVVHLFWGHYPALVTLLTKPLMPKTIFSLFLGAYDLEKRLPVSKWAAELSSCLFTHAQVNCSEIETLIDRNTVEVVYRGIVLDDYPSIGSLCLESRGLRIFTAGRFIEQKGFDKVLFVFAGISIKYPEAVLAIAGDGPDRKRLVKQSKELGIADRIEWLGWLSESEVKEQLIKSRVFLLFSSKPGERLPNVVKEAMAAGCICIVSPTPGIEELIDHEVDGFIYPAEDNVSILAAVEFGFYSGDSKHMSTAAAEKIRSNFDADISAAKYFDRWLRVLNKEQKSS